MGCLIVILNTFKMPMQRSGASITQGHFSQCPSSHSPFYTFLGPLLSRIIHVTASKCLKISLAATTKIPLLHTRRQSYPPLRPPFYGKLTLFSTISKEYYILYFIEHIIHHLTPPYTHQIRPSSPSFTSALPIGGPLL